MTQINRRHAKSSHRVWGIAEEKQLVNLRLEDCGIAQPAPSNSAETAIAAMQRNDSLYTLKSLPSTIARHPDGNQTKLGRRLSAARTLNLWEMALVLRFSHRHVSSKRDGMIS